jgi:hypothetical protein
MILLHWRVSRWNITSEKRVTMTYYFTGECDYFTSLKGVKMEYHFSEEFHDEVLLHWKISRWNITSLESVKVAYHANEECHDDTQGHWKVSWCMKFNWRMSRWPTSSPVSIVIYSANGVCHGVTKYIMWNREVHLWTKFGDNSNWKMMKACVTCCERREVTKYQRWEGLRSLRLQCLSTHQNHYHNHKAWISGFITPSVKNMRK